MAFATVLLYLIVIYVRPGEIVPAWQGLPLAAGSEAVALVAVAMSLLYRPHKFLDQPHDRYVAGFFAAVLLSNPAWGWLGGALLAFPAIVPSVLCYVLIRGGVRTAGQLKWAGYTLVAMSLVQAANGIQQYRTGVGFGNVAALEQNAAGRTVFGTEGGDDEDPVLVRRIQGTGIFNDPNDLAMLFVCVLPWVMGPALTKGRKKAVRLLGVAIAAPILLAMFYTSSRGGLVGFAAIVVAYVWGSKSIFTKGTAALGLVALLLFAPSGSGMDSNESSAQGRVQAWSAGLQMLKMRPILGVGFGRYIEYNDHVAHNSFVHTLGELGVVGGFCFVGMFYWFFRRVEVPTPAKTDDHRHDTFLSWGNDLRIGTIGLLVCSMFLSRQYVPVQFTWIALGACYRKAMEDKGMVAAQRATFADTSRVAASTVGAIVAVYVAVRVLAVWGG